jgi:hypothetical protein
MTDEMPSYGQTSYRKFLVPYLTCMNQRRTLFIIPGGINKIYLLCMGIQIVVSVWK